MKSNEKVYVVTGVSGRTGKIVANTLLDAGKRVRVVLRDEGKRDSWVARGAEIVIADLTDHTALTSAFADAHGVYVISPQQYTRDDLFVLAEQMAATIAEAALGARVPKLVALSSVGAEHVDGTGWIAMNRMLEQHLVTLNIPVTLLRAAYFMENWQGMITAASTEGGLSSFLSPMNHQLSMVATQDVGRIAAEALCEYWEGVRIIEVEGPRRYSPDEVADGLTLVLDQVIKAVAIPESQWADILMTQGFSTAAVAGFTEMTRGLNSGYISFADNSLNDHRKGSLTIENVITQMLGMTGQ